MSLIDPFALEIELLGLFESEAGERDIGWSVDDLAAELSLDSVPCMAWVVLLMPASAEIP